MDGQPRLYTDLVQWWPVLSSPDEYAAEAEFYGRCLVEAAEGPVRTVLELGSGGGNSASHLKAHFEMTLVDLSPGMLRVSRSLNPECEHVHGDMREVRLGRVFDAVFIHDAISYMLTEADLARAFETAWVHLRPGGAALFCPDDVRETFAPHTDHGGHDRMLRSLRYLEWTWDPDPDDTKVTTDFAYLLRDKDGVRVEYDRHITGLFPRAAWQRLLDAQGFSVEARRSGEPGARCEVFACRRTGR
ncbi:MAG: class I SAM-dependent methyltransferase [bacterium]